MDSAEEKYYRAEVFLRRGGQAYDVYGYEQSDIISDILDQFEKYMHFLHVSPGILPWRMEEHDADLITETPDETEASATDGLETVEGAPSEDRTEQGSKETSTPAPTTSEPKTKP